MQSYTVRVMMTNYNQFAMVFFKKVHDNQEFFKITLYGRSSPTVPWDHAPVHAGGEDTHPTQAPKSPLL